MSKVLISACFGALVTLAVGAPLTAAAQSGVSGQGGTFSLSATTTVSYGANGAFNSLTLAAGNYVCGDQLFGDPAPGANKSCYTSVTTPATTTTSSSTVLTLLTGQSGSFKLTSSSNIAYGSGAQLAQKTLSSGTYVCGDQLFGDPAPGQPKSCYSTSGSTSTTTPVASKPTSTNQLSMLIGQSGSFTLASAATVAYGSGSQLVEKSLAAGTYACGDQLFGDPAPGVNKQCYLSTTSASTPAATTPAVTTPVASTPSPVATNGSVLAVAGDVMVNGAVSNAEYQAMAQKMGTDAAIAYRYGPSSVDYGTSTQGGLPSYGKRNSQSLGMVSIQNPNGQGNRGCGWNGYCGTWQVGGPLEYAPGDYSSSVLNFAYVPDSSPDGSFYPKSYAAGVGSVQALSVGHNTMSIEPEASWTRYNGASSDGGSIDAGIETYQKSFSLEKPVALGKCYGRGGWCTNTLAAYADGRIVSVGSNTANNLVSTKLPSGKVPTAITLTNSGEFALVTVWDTSAMRGQIAVLALGDGCHSCTIQNENGGWESNWGNWKRSYPGLPGLGNYNFMKLVGFVDLPDTLKAPTEISASTGVSHWDYQAVRNYWDTDLDNNGIRNRFLQGDLSNAYARAGVAVVISKSEKRAAFVDLRPLFAYYKQQYFGQSQSGFNAMIANRGDGASQWPYTFDVASSQKPSVIKVVDLANRPTAVKVSLTAPHRAFIATQEGKLRVFDLGTGYLNQAGGGTPSDISERFSVDVGRNPTAISYVKEHGVNAASAMKDIYPNGYEKELIVTSRGDRKLQWVRFDAGFTNGSVARTLQESRMIDPISTEDADNHGTESYLVSVADYAGKGIHNFLYGPIYWHTYDASKACSTAKGGCKLLNNAPFEYGGTFKVPGKPFHAMGANIN